MIEKSVEFPTPLAIRYAKTLSSDKLPFDGNWNVLLDGKHIHLLAVGNNMLEVAIRVKQDYLLKAQVVNVTTVKPLDSVYLETINDGDVVVTLEENVRQGGFGSLVKDYFADGNVKVLGFAVGDSVAQGTVDEQMKMCGLDAESVGRYLLQTLKNEI